MIFRLLRYIGFALLIPGLIALGYCIVNGPISWQTDAHTFWGTPISLFVFWIGIAHAGTLISAIFLALEHPLDRRTSILAELTTICALIVAAMFPLVHLGAIENFYMVIPFLDARGNFANIQSPLVWDFCCIAIYAFLSLVFFVIHLFSDKNKKFDQLRKPLAWLLFPLVLWVHTIVSLDFAVTFVPEWRGGFFPLYFICGAIYSGIALVILVLAAERCRVRLLEKILIICSWFMFLFWLWNFILKGEWSASVFIFGALLPQLWWVSSIRESLIGRVLLAFSVLLGLWLERLFLVVPSSIDLTKIDFGLIAFSLGLFIVLFVSVRILLRKLLEGDDFVVGELSVENKVVDTASVAPLKSSEFIALRLPLLIGIVIALIYIQWVFAQETSKTVSLSFVNFIPIVFPLIILVTAIIFCAKTFWKNFSSQAKKVFAIMLCFAGIFLGAFWAGGESDSGLGEVSSQLAGESIDASGIWDSRCTSCHGVDGRFNEKFIREYYPVPQVLSLDRIDSIGEDSLVNVIMNGRVNMNAYNGRLSFDEAKSLVQYMRYLAEQEVKK